MAPKGKLALSESIENPISIPKSLHKHLQWWLQEENILVDQSLHPLQHAGQIITDTSNVSLGAPLGDFTARALWSIPESKLKLKGGSSGPKMLRGSLQGQDCPYSHRQHHGCCLHKQGRGCEIRLNLSLLWRLLSRRNLRNIILQTPQIPGLLNTSADKLSKQDSKPQLSENNTDSTGMAKHVVVLGSSEHVIPDTPLPATPNQPSNNHSTGAFTETSI